MGKNSAKNVNIYIWSWYGAEKPFGTMEIAKHKLIQMSSVSGTTLNHIKQLGYTNRGTSHPGGHLWGDGSDNILMNDVVYFVHIRVFLKCTKLAILVLKVSKQFQVSSDRKASDLNDRGPQFYSHWR